MRMTLAQHLDRVIYASALALLPLAAVPYGTVEPWSEAAFECAAFGLTGLWAVEALARGAWGVRGARLLAPPLALAGLALLQTFQAGGWEAASADPFETRLFASKLVALTAFGAILLGRTNSRRRFGALVAAVLLTALGSAAFGLARQASQGDAEGFVLTHLAPKLGYGQFINRNHFALLMEMALGLLLGGVLAGGARRERLPLWLAAAVPVWAALVLTYSRGGVFSMCGQLLLLLLTFRGVRGGRGEARGGGVRARRYALGACAFACVVAGAVWLGGDALLNRMEAIPEEVRAEGAETRAGVRRTEVWGATLGLIMESPAFGSGFGAYPVAITRFHDASGGWTPEAAHNDYLELVAGGGAAGALLALWFAFAFAVRVKKCLRADDPFRRAACYGALIGLSGVALHSLSDFGLHITANACVFVALVVIATAEVGGEGAGRDARGGRESAPSRRAARPLRALTACACVALCAGAAWAAARSGQARELSDAAARSGDEQAAALAAALSPGDPYAYEALAGVLSDAGRDEEAARAFGRAARLRPRDYFLWMELGRARDLAGDEAGARAAAVRAVGRAPFYAQPRWQLGNLLLRAGDRGGGFAELRRAAESDPKLLTAAVDLAWGASGGEAREALLLLEPRTDAARLALGKFLLGRGETALSLGLIREAAPGAAAAALSASGELLAGGKYCEAREVWSAAVGAGGPCDALADGGFEGGRFLNDAGFGWTPFRGSQTFQIRFDERAARKGALSLSVEFAGASDPKAPLLSQLIPVMPRARYRVSFAARAEELVTGGPPLVAVKEAAEGGGPLAASAPLAQGSSDWRDYTFTFETGAQTRAVTLAILRLDCRSAPCPVYGRAWFDDFSLERISDEVTGGRGRRGVGD